MTMKQLLNSIVNTLQLPMGPGHLPEHLPEHPMKTKKIRCTLHSMYTKQYFYRLYVFLNQSFWQYQGVSFSGTPFVLGETRWIASLDIIIKKRNKRAPEYLCKEQGARKMWCKAHIVIRNYILHPDFSVPRKTLPIGSYE